MGKKLRIWSEKEEPMKISSGVYQKKWRNFYGR